MWSYLVTELQAINLGIVGVQSAPADLPSIINAADLPMAITLPGPATWDKYAAARGQIQVQRVYTIQVFVMPARSGLGVAEGLKATIPMLVAFGARYLDDLSLGGLANGIDQVSDNGALSLTYSGQVYWGFELRLRVTQKGSVSDLTIASAQLIEQIRASGTAGAFAVPPIP